MTRNLTRRKILKYGLRGFLVAGVGKGFYNTTASQMEVVERAVAIPGLPAPFRGFTIALLSDFHASLIANYGLFEQAARLTMAKKPDLIALTGDFVTGATKFFTGHIGEFDKGRLDAMLDRLAPLSAPMGVYAVLGNHDFWSGPEAVRAIMAGFTRRLGAVWLRNTHAKLERGGARIDLLGVDDYWETSCSLARAYRGLGPDTPKILLSHNPDINDDVVPQTRIDLILSGHTHGGQVAAPIVGQPIVPSKFGQKYRAGLVRDGARQTYVTRGIGHLLAPVRFNCPPEVTILTLT